MTPKSLFNIILKIFGLFFLKEIIYTVPQLFSSILFVAQTTGFDNNQTQRFELAGIIIPVIIFSFYILLTYLLLFKTNYIIEKLKLDKGFTQEEFSISLSASFFLTLAIFVIGSVILLNEIPNFFNAVYLYFQQKSLTSGRVNSNFTFMLTAAVKIVLALLIMGERKRIVSLIQRK